MNILKAHDFNGKKVIDSHKSIPMGVKEVRA